MAWLDDQMNLTLRIFPQNKTLQHSHDTVVEIWSAWPNASSLFQKQAQLFV